MMLKVNEKVVNTVVKMVEEYVQEKYDMFVIGSVYGDRNVIGFRYATVEELRNLTAAYVYAENKMREEAKMTMTVDTKNKVVWIEVVTQENTEEQVDLNAILRTIRNAQRIKDVKLERATKAVERALEEYTKEIIGIVERMNEKDFLRVLSACGNEISPEEKDLIVTAYTSRRKEKSEYNNLW